MTRKRILVAALIALAALLLVAALSVNSLARSALEGTLSDTFGTESTVESVKLGLVPPRVRLTGVRVAGPEGFEETDFFSLADGRLSAGLLSVLRDTAEIRELRLEGMELYLEQRGRDSNFRPILASARAAGERREADGRAEGETHFRIDELVIRDVTARMRVGIGTGDSRELTVEVPEIRLEGVGSGERGAVSTSELAAIALQAALETVAAHSGNFPGQIRGLLRNELGAMGELPGRLDLQRLEEEVEERLRDEVEDRLDGIIPGRN